MMPSRPRTTPAPVNFSTTKTSASDFDTGLRKHTITPPTSDRVDRTSFSSIKENSSGVAQSFTDSKTSSYLRHEFELDGSEDAILDDGSSSGSTTPVLERKPAGAEVKMLNPYSALHGFVSPAEGFMGWKSISIRGKTASKSFGDLRSLAMKFEWDCKVEKEERVVQDGAKVGGESLSGQSPFEKLPTELLGELLYSNYLISWGPLSCLSLLWSF